MGTHCAFAVRKNGELRDVERTMDGYNLVHYALDWMQEIAQGKNVQLDVEAATELIGTGGIQHGEDREHDQEYFFGVDFDNKVIYCSFWIVDDVLKSAQLIVTLVSKGWKVEIGYDTVEMEAAK